MAIPAELQAYRQWVVWRLEERSGSAKPTKIPYSPVHGFAASVTNPSDWGSFEDAEQYADKEGFNGVGFVLAKSDPFTFIDLDATQVPEDRELQRKIVEKFNSYTERSPSKKGAHIIVRGIVPTGRRRRSVEIYSSDRYMTMTGDVVRDVEIVDGGAALSSLYDLLSPPIKSIANHTEEPDTGNDAEILRWAGDASNGELFRALWAGDWASRYESQSQADYALISILGHYTWSRLQVHRLFLASGLANRQKSHRADYVSKMLDACFDNKPPRIDVAAVLASLLAVQDADTSEFEIVDNAPPECEPTFPKPHVAPPPKASAKIQKSYPYPTGIVGDLAEFIYAASPYQLREAALMGALSLVAGMAGRCFNVSGTGLNQYFILIGPTGVGKDSAQIGLNVFRQIFAEVLPTALAFVGPGEIASPQALTKHLAEHPSCVSYSGEIGHLIQEMSTPEAVGVKQGLKRLLLQIYSLSGANKSLGATIYSDKTKNVETTRSPSFTWAGETTPDGFYPNIDERMVREGLIPRFLIIETSNVRPPLNKSHKSIKPSTQLQAAMVDLAHHCVTLNAANRVSEIPFASVEAESIFDDFEVYCSKKINSADRDIKRAFWTRQNLKALKLAGLIAVGQKFAKPAIDSDTARWAIRICVQDVENMLARFDAGEITMGDSENQQIDYVIERVRMWMLSPWVKVASYAPGPGEKMHAGRVIPYGYIQRTCVGVSSFRRDRLGSTNAIKRAVQQLLDRGDLIETPKSHLAEQYGTTSKAYMVGNMSAFRLK